jgi:hypothetical protein
MAFGIVRSLQLLATLVVAVPVALVGLFNVLEGRLVLGVVFVAMAAGLVGVSEYVYTRLTDRTVGRIKRLKNFR